jgi:uncharacterized protein YjlB
MGLTLNPNASFSHHVMAPDKFHPNNLKLPVLYYKQVLNLADNDEQEVKELFEKNGWSNSWTDSIQTYHHYHSNTHEVLAVVKGSCMVMLGGDDGNIQNLSKGDVIVLPAGVAHKNVGSSADFACIGAYPNGTEYDMNTCETEAVSEAKEKIRKVSLPERDPVFGDKGPVREVWKKEEDDTVLQKERQF